uniref:Uncharacterized protein n=1 Tax=Knipowitschia caucasica TaxID=637954 RepID=A0AAV2LRY5_KNICA
MLGGPLLLYAMCVCGGGGGCQFRQGGQTNKSLCLSPGRVVQSRRAAQSRAAQTAACSQPSHTRLPCVYKCLNQCQKRGEKQDKAKEGGMVDNSGSSKAQMPSMSQESGVAFPQSTSSGGMKLEAVMEQLQRQQQARLEMERKERKLREAHIMYAQQVAAQQAILAAARASGAGFMGKAMTGGVPGGGLPPRMSNQSSVDSEREDDEDRGRDSGEEDDDTEMMEGDEGSDDEGSASGLEFLRKQTLALQQSASRIPPRPFGSYSASAPQRAASPPVRVKQEPDEGLSPAGAHSATSPNGQADWGFDDHFRQLLLALCSGSGLAVVQVVESGSTLQPL